MIYQSSEEEGGSTAHQKGGAIRLRITEDSGLDGEMVGKLSLLVS